MAKLNKGGLDINSLASLNFGDTLEITLTVEIPKADFVNIKKLAATGVAISNFTAAVDTRVEVALICASPCRTPQKPTPTPTPTPKPGNGKDKKRVPAKKKA